MELSGWTAVDTLYELKGYEIASNIFNLLYGPLSIILFGVGLILVLHKTTVTDRFRGVFIYIFMAIFMMWLIAPISVTVNLPAGYTWNANLKDMVEAARSGKQAKATIDGVPRIMAFSHYAVDVCVRHLTGAVNKSFEKKPWEHDRSVVLLKHSRIEDETLRENYHKFVIFCYLPVLATRERKNVSPPDPYFDPFQKGVQAEYQGIDIPKGEWAKKKRRRTTTYLDYPCKEALTNLDSRIDAHIVEEHYETRKSVSAALQSSEARPKIDITDYLHPQSTSVVRTYLLYNETVGLFSTNEVKALMAALPDYEMFDRKTMSSSNGEGFWGQARSVVSWLVKGYQSIDQWIQKHGEGPALYYKVTSYGPYVYGLTSMIILAIFPIAGFISILPGYHTSILTWVRLILWVKLWLVFWSILSKFNEWRWNLDEIGNGSENGIGDQSYIFPAIAAMYLLTPTLSFIIVQLLAAGAKGVGNAMSGGSMAPSAGSVGGGVAGAAADGAKDAGKAAVQAAAM